VVKNTTTAVITSTATKLTTIFILSLLNLIG
jgi:hypothetical protein